jgi:hypothetical protein
MNEELQASTLDLALRRVRLFDYIHQRILPHLSRPNVLVVRYERWFSEPERLVKELQAFLEVELSLPKLGIRRSDVPPLANEERALVRAHCSTAEALGYEL